MLSPSHEPEVSRMSFAQKTVVVIGAAGVVGSGITRKYLDAGATVLGVSRNRANLDRLRDQVKIKDAEAFVPVIGDFKDEDTAATAKRAITGALAGRAVDHVVSVQGFVTSADAPTKTPVSTL